MLVIDDKIISLDLLQEEFVCQLDACKGACCVKGDFGAPLSEEEGKILSKEWRNFADQLPVESLAILQSSGVLTYYDEMEGYGTPLRSDGACVFATFDEEGTARCVIEEAHSQGKTSLQKPISCHLYPIRVTEYPAQHFQALNYDRWDICSPACQHGNELGVKVYEFAKEALIRTYGLAFYEALCDADRELSKTKDNTFE